MNERIMKLAIQAREYAESNPDIYAVAYDKKFAELMIKDFLWQLAYARMEYVFDHKVDEVFKKTIADVKKHYGVEK
jgi:hypothetical protein